MSQSLGADPSTAGPAKPGPADCCPLPPRVEERNALFTILQGVSNHDFQMLLTPT